MKRMKTFLALGAFFVVAVALSGCGSGIPGNAVADMAGNPISTTAFKHWMYIAAKGSSAQTPGAPVIVPSDPPNFDTCISQVKAQIPTFAKGKTDAQIRTACKQLFTSLSGQVMDFLIRAYWYQAQAKKLGITVSDADINKAFAAAKKQQFPTAAAFNTFLSQSGQTLNDIMFRVRVNEIYKKLLAKHQSTVSAAAIQTYYNSHTSQFGKPETRNIRIVRTNTLKAANAAKAALAHGQSWDAVTKKYSIDSSTKNKGGVITGVKKGQEEQALDTAAFGAKLNTIVGPVHGQFGYYVVQVTKIIPGSQQSLAQATPLIKQILNGNRQTAAQSAVDAQAKKSWLSKTKCRSAYSMADCSGYKAPKATSTVAPSTTTAAPTTTSSSP
jgi:foldase protein PrsA